MEPELRFLYDGETVFRAETRPLGSGEEAQVMTAWPEGARYSQQEAYFARDGGIWSLRVWRYAPAEPEETIQWTAPNYQPPGVPMTFRQKREEPAKGGGEEIHISQAELQQTADKVYRMIEDRIRRERHRLGL